MVFAKKVVKYCERHGWLGDGGGKWAKALCNSGRGLRPNEEPLEPNQCGASQICFWKGSLLCIWDEKLYPGETRRVNI